MYMVSITFPHPFSELTYLKLKRGELSYLLREFRHVHWLDFSQGRQPFQPLFGLLFDRDDESVLDMAVLCQFLGCNIKIISNLVVGRDTYFLFYF